MELQFYVLFLAAFSFLRGLSGQDIVTFSSKEEEKLECSLGNANSLQWSVVGEGIPLCSYTVPSGDLTPGSNDTKYTNFDCSLTQTNVDLIIRNVDKDDGGGYVCTRIPGTQVTYSVTVEVTPVSVDINNGNEVIVGEKYSFTCTAVGVRSPNVLNLTWSTNNDIATERSEITQGSDLQDLTSTLEFSPQRDDTFIKCGITGYVNQDEINEDIISDTVQLTVHYAPICALQFGEAETSETGCTVKLTCNCDANPEVTTNGYSYFKDNTPIDGNGDTTTGDVASDTKANFSCRGRNAVGSGDQSPAKEYTCSTTTPTPMKTETTPSTEEPSSLGIIIAFSCIGGILVLVVIGGLVYWFCFRNQGSSKSNHNTDKDFEVPQGGMNNTVTASAAATTNSAAPVYGVVNKSTKKKSDNTDGNGVNAKLAASQPEPTEPAEYASVNKPKSQPQAAPRSSAPPEKMELQYADIDHGNRGPSNEIRQPADAPTEYATVQSVIV